MLLHNSLIAGIIWICAINATPCIRAPGSRSILVDFNGGIVRPELARTLDPEYSVDCILENNAQGVFKTDDADIRRNEAGGTVMVQRNKYLVRQSESNPLSVSSYSYPEQAPAAFTNVGPIEPSSGKLESREDIEDIEDGEDGEDGEDHEYDGLDSEDAMFLMPPTNIPGFVDWVQTIQEGIEHIFGIHNEKYHRPRIT